LNAPAQYPGCTGTRNLADNISDLRAQVAANQKVSFIQLFIQLYLLLDSLGYSMCNTCLYFSHVTLLNIVGYNLILFKLWHILSINVCKVYCDWLNYF